MASTRVSSIVRRAVVVQLAATASGLMACGGQTAPSAFDGGSYGSPPDGGLVATCVVTSSVPIGIYGGSCLGWTYPFRGSYEECEGDAAMPSQSLCERLCPPPPDGGGVPAGTTVLACGIFACGDGPADCSVGSALGCYYDACSFGRRPAGLRRRAACAEMRPVARFLARMAYLEAASVPAFERLARELAAHGAPDRLQRAARRAMRDEQRHARVATSLAARAGAQAPRPRVARRAVRSLETIARENAVEGCVRETFGAAVAWAQSLTATDPHVRAAMDRIGADELRHADLAWDVARWLDTRLDGAARNRVARAQRRAARDLLRAAAREVHADLVAQLGMPGAMRARAIALDLTTTLWDARHGARPGLRDRRDPLSAPGVRAAAPRAPQPDPQTSPQ
jgi:hypothetical protein